MENVGSLFLGSKIKLIGETEIFLAKALYSCGCLGLIIFLFIRTIFKQNERMLRIERAHANTRTRTHARPRSGTRTDPNARDTRLRTPTASSATRAGARTHPNPKAIRARPRTSTLAPPPCARSTQQPHSRTSKSPLCFFFSRVAQVARGCGPRFDLALPHSRES